MSFLDDLFGIIDEVSEKVNEKNIVKAGRKNTEELHRNMSEMGKNSTKEHIPICLLIQEFEFQLTQMEKQISRTKIEASILNARGEVADTLINQFFEERGRLCELLEKVLGEAIERADSEMTEVVLHVLEVLYSENVFKKINGVI